MLGQDFYLKNLNEIIILLGDIGYPNTKVYNNFLEYLSNIFDDVYFIYGNHEYFGFSIENPNNTLKNVHYMNNDSIIINNNVILFTTLWTFIPKEYSDYVFNKIHDYKRIPNHTVNGVNKMYLENVEWLTKEIEKYSNYNIIVCSHHAPSFKCISSKYTGDILNYNYASDLEYLMGGCKYWLYGHTHNTVDITINGCIVSSNQYGYNNDYENIGLNLNKFILI